MLLREKHGTPDFLVVLPPAVVVAMSFRSRLLSVCALLCGLGPLSVFAQLPQAVLYEVFPAGGQAGTEVPVTIQGVEVDGTAELVFSDARIKAVQLSEELFGKTRVKDGQFRVTIPKDVSPGLYEVRVKTRFGMSNPRRFEVSSLTETVETESNNTREEAQEIGIDQIVSGKANGRGDVDYFRFAGKAGQAIVIECRAEQFDSLFAGVMRLFAPSQAGTFSGSIIAAVRGDFGSDAVLAIALPQDGEYTLKVHDLAYNYSGKSYAHAYRLKIHTGPHVAYVWPPSGKRGTSGSFTLYGYNLPGGAETDLATDSPQPLQKLDVAIPLPAETTLDDASLAVHEADVDAITYVFQAGGRSANPVLVHLTDREPVPEVEPNHGGGTPQAITLPIEIAGRFGKRGDLDSYRFTAKKGEQWAIEVFSQRLGHAVDPVFMLYQLPTGEKKSQPKRLALQDDTGKAFINNVLEGTTDDPSLVFTAPADGDYRLTLKDRYGDARGGDEMIYRLRIRKASPDFRVVALPAYADPKNGNRLGPGSILLRRGGTETISVYAYRKDGYNGPIEIVPESLPEGVTCAGAYVAPGENSTSLIFAAAVDAKIGTGPVTLQARASLPRGDKTETVTHPVRAFTISNGPIVNNYPPVTRPTERLTLSVLDRTIPWDITAEPVRLTVHQGRQILVPIAIGRRDGAKDDIKLTPQGLPRNANVTAPTVTLKEQNAETLRLFVNTNAKEGTFSFYFKADGKFPKYHPNPTLQPELEAEQKRIAGLLDTAKKRRDDANRAKSQSDSELNRKKQEASQAEKEFKAATDAVKKAKDDPAKKAANMKLAEATTKRDAANAALKVAEQARKAAYDEQPKAEAEYKRLTDAKKKIDGDLNTAKRTQAKDIAISQNVVPILLTVKKAPLTLGVSTPSGVTIKRGESLTAKVQVRRSKGFTEPVTLSLPLPPGIGDLTAPPVTVPGDQKEGELIIKAGPNATEGQLANMIIRAETKQAGQPVLVEIPVTLKVNK